MILERRGVVLSADSIDITNEAIARINAVLPEGVGPEVDARQSAAAIGSSRPRSEPSSRRACAGGADLLRQGEQLRDLV